ncbi:hypothetical protein L218DRAFT_994149 [Marasmius fiardii PR-910]|nr:hypothetical protein L218DRAFT_994149 [Marasmius fiardii PR-910]
MAVHAIRICAMLLAISFLQLTTAAPAPSSQAQPVDKRVGLDSVDPSDVASSFAETLPLSELGGLNSLTGGLGAVPGLGALPNALGGVVGGVQGGDGGVGLSV